MGKETDEERYYIETVDVIASGYEFICPSCDNLNKLIEVRETVTCQNCKGEHEVGETHHAIS